METRRLETFIRIVDTGSLTRAARLLGIAQPALSQQMAALEADFGAKLLTRSHQGVAPTAAGQTLYRYAQAMLKQLEIAAVDVTQTADDLAGTVNIGLPTSVVNVISVPLVEAAKTRHPDISLNFMDSLPGELMCELTANGRLDIALLPAIYESKGLKIFPMLNEQLGVVIPAANRLAQEDGPIALEDLADEPLILPGPVNALRRSVETAFESRGLKPLIVAEMNSVSGLCAAAAANLGCTFVPLIAQPVINPALLAIRPVIQPEITRTLYLAVSEVAPMTPQTRALWDMIIETVTIIVKSGGWKTAELAENMMTGSWRGE